MRVQEPEQAEHPHPGRRGALRILVAIEEVQGGHLVVDDEPRRLAVSDAPVVLGDALLLLRVAHGRDPECPEAALGGVDLGARARDRDPHGRMGLLQGLGLAGHLGQAVMLALVGDGVLGPQPNDDLDLLFAHPPAVLQARAIGLELRLAVARADPGDDAAARHLVHDRDRLGPMVGRQ